jgi:hypothetical protein
MKQWKWFELVVVGGEDSMLVVVEYDIKNGGWWAGRWLEGAVDGARGLKD